MTPLIYNSFSYGSTYWSTYCVAQVPGLFNTVIVNEDLDTAYHQLKMAIESRVPGETMLPIYLLLTQPVPLCCIMQPSDLCCILLLR